MSYQTDRFEFDARHVIFFSLGFVLLGVGVVLAVNHGYTVKFGHVVEFEKNEESTQTDTDSKQSQPESSDKEAVVESKPETTGNSVRHRVPQAPVLPGAHSDSSSNPPVENASWDQHVQNLHEAEQLKREKLQLQHQLDIQAYQHREELARRDALLNSQKLEEAQEEINRLKQQQIEQTQRANDALARRNELKSQIDEIYRQPSPSNDDEGSQENTLTPQQKVLLSAELKKNLARENRSAIREYYRVGVLWDRAERRRLGWEFAQFIDVNGEIDWSSTRLLQSEYSPQARQISAAFSVWLNGSGGNYGMVSRLCSELRGRMARQIHSNRVVGGSPGVSSYDYVRAKRMLEFLERPDLYLPGFQSEIKLALAKRQQQKTVPLPEDVEGVPSSRLARVDLTE